MWFDLKGDARLWRCSTADCGGQPTFRLEWLGMGSNYCSGCREEIDKSFLTYEPAAFEQSTRQEG